MGGRGAGGTEGGREGGKVGCYLCLIREVEMEDGQVVACAMFIFVEYSSSPTPSSLPSSLPPSFL